MLTEQEIAQIVLFFRMKGYTWYSGKEQCVPGEKEIEAMLESLGKITIEEDGDTDASSGKLLVKKVRGHREVWIYAGDLNESD